MLVEHCKTSTKMTLLSGKIVHGAEKDLVETRSIRRLRSYSPKKENRRPIFEKLPKRLSRKIKVEIESEDAEPADHQIRRNDVIKLDAYYNLGQNNASHSDNFVDMELSSDATSLAPSLPRAKQLFSSLSQPVSTTPSHRLNLIHEEARHLRSQISLSTKLSTVLSQLERFLELSASIVREIRGSVAVEVHSQAIECFDYVWCASKMAVCRWEDMEGSTGGNSFIRAVKYAYTTLPIFIKWEKREHIEIVEHIILLSVNTVKNCQAQPSSSIQAVIEAVIKKKPMISVQKIVNTRPQSFKSKMMTEERTNKKVKVVPSVAKVIIKKESEPLVHLPKEKDLDQTLEFCRLVNTAIWQNTKERTTSGLKDDSGVYHPMYRYGIGKMLNLYCPGKVTHLKCCGKVFDLLGLKAHVSQYHEAGRPNRTEPSISPL